MRAGAASNRLREIRLGASLTQQQLAQLSGVSQWTISRIEHGKRHPQVGPAYRLAQAMGVRIEDIFFSESTSDMPIAVRQNADDPR